MDQEKVKHAERRMREVRAALVKGNPFFGHLAMNLELACAPCGTACTDGDRLIFDPEFAEKLTDQEMHFVTLHEVMHCVLEHCLRGKNLHSFLYNVACDIVVNSIILEMWGMDRIKIAGAEAMHVAPDGKEGRLYNAEEIYQMMMKKQNIIPGKKSNGRGAFEKKGAPDECSSSGQSGRSGSVSISSAASRSGRESDSSSGSDSASSLPISPEYAPFDRHDLWQGINDKSQLRDDWKGRIRNAAKVCGDSAGMPPSIRKVVQGLVERSELDWKQLLHDFLQFDQYDYSFLPPDRRYAGDDFYLPAFNIDEDDGSAREIWVCVDTSGSISEEDLTSAMSEILDAMRQARLTGKISFFDTRITEPEPFETEADVKKITPVGGGGTSFQIIFDYLREEMYQDLPQAILIFTDGYAPWPKERDALEVPVLWLISRDGKTDAPWGRVAVI